MSAEIVKYKEEHIPAVEDFNARMRQGGMPPEFELPRTTRSIWLPRTNDNVPYNEYHLVLSDSAVRGVFVIKHEDFSFRGAIRRVACCHHPYSEGIVNKKYAAVGLQIFRYVAAKHPLIYALGMQGYERPLPQLLIKMGWSHCLLPFSIRIINPHAFFANMGIFRGSRLAKIAALARKSRLAFVAVRGAQQISQMRYRVEKADFEVVDQFGDWANQVWARSEPEYAVLPVRTFDVLRTLYPTENSNFLRLRVTRSRDTIGWAVVGHLRRENDANYGNLYVGTILDTLAKPQDAVPVISAATEVLESLGVDLIVSNQSHPSWNKALTRCGFLRAPSNYIFATSKKMAELMAPFEQTVAASHLNRSSSDGISQFIFLGSNSPLTASSSSQETNPAFVG